MDGPPNFFGVLMLGDAAGAGVEGGLLTRDTLLNLRDFRSEALVWGNCAVLCFGDVAEVDAWAVFVLIAGASLVGLFFSEGPLIRRFLRGR